MSGKTSEKHKSEISCCTLVLKFGLMVRSMTYAKNAISRGDEYAVTTYVVSHLLAGTSSVSAFLAVPVSLHRVPTADDVGWIPTGKQEGVLLFVTRCCTQMVLPNFV